jgi:glycosyltransferase involved in cell wall biosynthesis
LRKLAWQKRVRKLAIDLHRRNRYRVVHQTTFHSFRVPFLAAQLGVPSVWGPIAGGEHIPPGFERYLGGARFAEVGRQRINRLWLRLPDVRRSFERAGTVFVSNRTTLNFLPSEWRQRCLVVPPNALRAEDECWPEPTGGLQAEPLRLLYVGNCVATRSIPLVFEALKGAGLERATLTVAGTGPAIGHWKRQAAAEGLGGRVGFMGQVPHDQLSSVYRSAHVLVFPALRDSGGSALLEAMARHMPVVCFDWAGPGEMLDEASGVKIPVANPDASVRAFSSALVRLQAEPELRRNLGRAARKRAETMFRWEAKRELLEKTYASLMR